MRIGVIFYEMHMPIFLKAQLSFKSNGIIDTSSARIEFEKSVNCIQESMEHLQFNSRGSFGNQLYIGAQDTLKQLNEHLKKLS